MPSVAEIFADTTDQTIGAVGVATVVGGVLKWMWDKWTEDRQERRADSASKRADVVKHMQGLIDRLTAAHTESRNEVHQLRNQLHQEISRAATNTARTTARIVYLETVLEANDIKVKPWADPPIPPPVVPPVAPPGDKA